MHTSGTVTSIKPLDLNQTDKWPPKTCCLSSTQGWWWDSVQHNLSKI